MLEKQHKPNNWIHLNELRTSYIFQCYYDNNRDYNENIFRSEPNITGFIEYIKHYIEFMRKEMNGVVILCKKSNYKFYK